LNGVWSLYIVDDFDEDGGSISGGFSITFENPVQATYSWSPAALMSNPAIANPKALVNSPTWFYLTTQNTSSGCLTTDSVFVNTAVRPKPLITPGDTAVCFGTILKLAVRDTGAYTSGYPVGTTIDWLGIVNGRTQADSINSDNGTNYQVVVTIPSGCSATSSVRTILTRSVSTSTSVVQPACGSDNGSITGTVTAGTAPYRFVWKLNNVIIKDTVTNLASHTIRGLAPGNYSMEITDLYPGGCSSGIIESSLNYTVPPSVTLNASSVSCNGDQNAVIAVTVSGGVGTLSYLWEDGSFAAFRSDLSAGSYTLTVTDAVGCTDIETVSITEPTAITAVVTPINPTCAGSANGELSALVSGGISPYLLEWYYNDPIDGLQPVSNSAIATGLIAGDYQLFVVDANNCEELFYRTLTQPAPVIVSGFLPSAANVGSSITINGSGFVNVTAVSFNGTSASGFTANSATSISVTVPVGATTGPVTVTAGSCSGVSALPFTVTTPGSSVVLNIKLFLQGFYVGGDLMTPVLFNNGLSTNPEACDTVTVELRSATTPGDPPVAVRSLLVSADGTAQAILPASVSGNSYYLVVKHRNSLETWSKLPVTFTSVTTFDFTQ
jgi:hypothetical protein